MAGTTGLCHSLADQADTSRAGNIGDLRLPQTVHGGQPHALPHHLKEHNLGLSLNPEAEQFTMRDASLVRGGLLHPDLDQDWVTVREVQAGGCGPQSETCGLWGRVQPPISDQPAKRNDKSLVEPLLPFSLSSEDLCSGLVVPAKPVLRASSLKESRYLQVPLWRRSCQHHFNFWFLERHSLLITLDLFTTWWQQLVLDLMAPLIQH